MKKIIITVAFIFTLLFAAFPQQSFQRINDDEVSQTGLRQATSLAEKLMLGQKSGNIYLLSEEEAIPQVAKGLTEGIQASSYESVRSMFGDYLSMEFAEAWKMETDQVYTMYRFKGTFSESTDKPEIQVVFNTEGKLAGFWIRPWEDDLGGQP